MTQTSIQALCRLHTSPLAVLAAFAGLAALMLAPAKAADSGKDRICGPQDPTRLQITVQNIRSASGTITIMLYGDSDADFLKKGGRLSRIRVPAKTGEITACMPVPAPGSYALSLYHDEDANRKLTKNFVGLPIEGHGFSRDAAVTYRLPDLDEAVFTALPGDTHLRITLRY